MNIVDWQVKAMKIGPMPFDSEQVPERINQ